MSEMNKIKEKIKDKPWMIRTYAGHSSAMDSNKLYRENLKKGQTGLSVAFDLPTQTGYDSDHILSKGEVGKVGVPISHIGNMQTLFNKIPLDQMNTSMTINAPAPWLLALYIATAEKQGVDKKHLSQIRDGARCRVSISRAAVEGIFEGIIFDVHGVKTSTIRDLTPRHDLYRSRSRGNDGDDGDDRARTHRRVVVRPHGSNTHSRHRTHAKQKHSLTK